MAKTRFIEASAESFPIRDAGHFPQL